MRVIKGLKNLKSIKNSVVTIGVFDGVHLGHRKIIGRVISKARKTGLKSVVVTFDPHPLKVLNPRIKTPSLISLNHKIRLIEALGVDYLVVINFTTSFSRIGAEKFIRTILSDKLGARFICVGPDFYLGKGAKFGPSALKDVGLRYGFSVEVVKKARALGKVISSSLIRDRVQKGEIAEAEKLLGRPVAVLGTVVAGTGLARYLGYPTANVNPHHEAIPPTGVYAVKVVFKGRSYDGILNIGFRPTFYSSNDKEPSIEVHIFSFKGDLYGNDIEILFVKRIRLEKKFKVIADLVEQIKKDEKSARSILSKRLYKSR